MAQAQAQAAVDFPRPQAVDWDRFVAALDGIQTIREPALVKQKSRDFYWYSPILKEQLKSKFGDIVVLPRNVDEVVKVAATCAKFRAPLVMRGGGTGNYGQAMPLEGGVILETTLMDKILWRKHDVLRVQAGKKLIDIDAELRPQGWEIRLHPSTKRTATVGGFIAGGSGGIGSVMWGVLRERGQIHALKIVTVEETPRVIELRGDEVQRANHAYGTNGIIVELEMPLGIAEPWVDVIVAFDDLRASLAFGQEVAETAPIVKKLVSTCAWPIPQYFRQLREACPEGKHIAIAMISETSMESFRRIVEIHGGRITYEKRLDETDKAVPLYEYTWNHTTLQALKVDRTVTYLQTLFPFGSNIDLMMHMHEKFGDEVMIHAEFVRIQGRITNSALQIVRYTTPERLFDIIAYHEKMNCRIANPHTFVLEDGGMKRIDKDQLAFKFEADPFGLLNPGKMRGWAEAHALGIRKAADVGRVDWQTIGSERY